MAAYQLTAHRKSSSQAGLPADNSRSMAHRTLRMDTGGICQFCARKAARRVELESPLWLSGPLMYGDCCLPLAEAAISAAFNQRTAPISHPRRGTSRPWLASLAAAALLTGLAEWLRHFFPSGLSRPF